jgi:hypothetical protein
MYGSFSSHQNQFEVFLTRKRVRTPEKKEEEKKGEKTAESLIGFPFFSFSCRISHDRGIRKKNLYDDNDS